MTQFFTPNREVNGKRFHSQVSNCGFPAAQAVECDSVESSDRILELQIVGGPVRVQALVFWTATPRVLWLDTDAPEKHNASIFRADLQP